MPAAGRKSPTSASDSPQSALLTWVDLPGRMERNPYQMMIGAIGVGFVLGGGLFTRLTARLVGVGLRTGMLAALPLLQEKVMGAADDVFTAARTQKQGEKR